MSPVAEVLLGYVSKIVGSSFVLAYSKVGPPEPTN